MDIHLQRSFDLPPVWYYGKVFWVGGSNGATSSSSSGACWRRSRCHEFPPCRSVLNTPLRRRQSEVHWSQVSLHRSQPGLSGTINPPSPIIWLDEIELTTSFGENNAHYARPRSK